MLNLHARYALFHEIVSLILPFQVIVKLTIVEISLVISTVRVISIYDPLDAGPRGRPILPVSRPFLT